MATDRISTLLKASVAVAALTLGATEAMAGGFSSRQQSATGQGFSFAGAGTSTFGLGSMFWNPANITNFEGRNSEWNVPLIMPNTSVNTISGSVAPTGTPFTALGIAPGGSGNINQAQISTASYNSYQINQNLFIGLQTGTPFGSRTKADPGFGGAVYGTSTVVRGVAITPTLGYKVNDWFSVGVGITLQQLTVALSGGDARISNAFFANPLTRPIAVAGAPSYLKGDGYGIGWTAGFTVKPAAGTEISLGIRSHIKHKLEGSLFNYLPVGRRDTLISTNVNLPEIVTLGLSQRLNQQWTATGTVQWTNWSRVKTAPLLNRTTGVPITGLGFKYKDEWFIAAGLQYQHNANWTFRGGVAYEKAPIGDENRGVRVLDSDRIWLSAGVGYKINEKLSLDFGYSHIFLKSGKVNIVAAGNPLNPVGNPAFTAFNYSGTSRGSVDIINLSLKYRWDEPARRAAVITK
jgi:long-chain fatty acid transport protein